MKLWDVLESFPPEIVEVSNTDVRKAYGDKEDDDDEEGEDDEDIYDDQQVLQWVLHEIQCLQKYRETTNFTRVRVTDRPRPTHDCGLKNRVF